MKNIKYLLLSAILIAFTACSDDDYDYNPAPEPLPELTAGSVDLSTYVAVGASFSAGYTDNALFIKGQENSFPNILSGIFSNVGGGTFSQPLMKDNIGGFVLGSDIVVAPRLYLDLTGPSPAPKPLNAVPTTQITEVLSGPFNNYGIPGAKSFHLGIPGYAALNPYFGRMASSATATVLGDAVAQNPTFFTLSEIGGNDVLAYATSGGTGVYQLGNLDPSTYGSNDITDPDVFTASFSAAVNALTSNGAKGVVTNVPYVTNLAHFTTVPHNPLDPSNPSFGPQIPLLNSIFGALNQIFTVIDPSRVIEFSETAASAVVINDESLTNIAPQIAGALNASPTFPAFIAQFGLPAEAAPLVAGLLANTYGQARQATADDLLVLPSSSVIGTVNMASVQALMAQGLPQELAGQFSVEGVTLPLADKWVLIPSEQADIKAATDLYNQSIAAIADQKDLALVDFKGILQTATETGFSDGDFTFTTALVTGGLISLDGVHLTSRGYSLMANEFLKAIDAKYGSNFVAAGYKAKPGEYPTNYNPALR
ncbi:SGNH/GDSL hydrolase family protein [Gelidibacter maritimus]|uniref:G-D-S-L family lipolytic protein n=1 Tax=Gelidibacter maritimus TaxID=2761487 RepID=A0A7W2M3M8_9FLAO|nr:G-D-S-L family lipolytic protein [Gelidibacter maritimus]MBA6152124.1 G-D-S-L family lipolytic protein [Gelidibacter maritimus]